MKVSVDIIYSEQAKIAMNEFKNFNKEEFEKEYLKSFTVGDKMIYEYVLSKAVQRRRKIIYG